MVFYEDTCVLSGTVFLGFLRRISPFQGRGFFLSLQSFGQDSKFEALDLIEKVNATNRRNRTESVCPLV